MISTSFADIFKQNSLKNSLLPIVVPPDVHAELFAAVAKDPDATVKVDLAGADADAARTAARSSFPWTRSPSTACWKASTSWATS